MNIKISYEESEIANILNNIIVDPDKDFFIKMITPLICKDYVVCHKIIKKYNPDLFKSCNAIAI